MKHCTSSSRTRLQLAAEFGVPEGGKHPKLRVAALLQAGTMRWKAAAIGGYHDGENALADQFEGALGPVSCASPTAASSPWTAGSASPPLAPTSSGRLKPLFFT